MSSIYYPLAMISGEYVNCVKFAFADSDCYCCPFGTLGEIEGELHDLVNVLSPDGSWYGNSDIASALDGVAEAISGTKEYD